jgi:hypothetical protein
VRIFDPSERLQVTRAAARAEELTRDFYRIPGRERPRFPYDLATLADDPGPRRRVFADVVRVVLPASLATGRDRREIYRIRLRDDRLLAAADAGADVELFSLLLYVVTHELVHIVRFRSGLAVFDDTDDRARRDEELRVHSITQKVLAPARDDALRIVVDRFFSDGTPGDSLLY